MLVEYMKLLGLGVEGTKDYVKYPSKFWEMLDLWVVTNKIKVFVWFLSCWM